MYLGIDVGGTKTIVAALDDSGVIRERQKYPTPKDYQEFLKQLSASIETFSIKDFIAAGIGIPVTNFSRQNEIAHSFSNLPWKDVAVKADLEKLANCPVAVENDAKLAGLSESMLRDPTMHLLYLTVSTGIGFSLIVNRKIDPNVGDSGGRLMVFEHRGTLVPWESFASGKAIVETFGKQAKDIHDKDTWDQIARNICQGLIELIAITEPDVVVIGGSVGVYLDRFIDPLNKHLKELETPLLKIPPIEAAVRAEDAVVYGCYDYAKEVFGITQ
jgi:glucokinase